MTRCLDCGAERSSDQCPACGLTTAAAEVIFRRRLLRRTAIFLLGSLIFPSVSQLYPPLDSDLMLVFYGAVFFAALALAVVADRRAHRREELEVVKRIYFGFIPLPWILVGALFLNGKIASGPDQYYTTTVVGKFEMKGIVRGSRRLFVHSWRPGQSVERLAVDLDDFDRFRAGDAIVVRVQPGALGIPWVFGVFRH
jgi:hypothetical protein